MALAAADGYFHCEYCGSYYFPDTTKGGIRLLGESQAGLLCPVCAIPLEVAKLDDRYPVSQCPNCRGLLLDRTDFRETLRARRSAATSPPGPPREFDREELQRDVSCPQCKRAMSTLPYLGPGNIVIDTCDHCDLIWLDYGELQQAEKAPGRDRGTSKDLTQGASLLSDSDPYPLPHRRRRRRSTNLIAFLRDYLLED